MDTSNDKNSNSSVIMIGNPIYGPTFNAIFSVNSPTINQISGKDRLLSFLQEMFPDDEISLIEYIDTTNQNIRDKFIFYVACKCFDQNGNIMYDVEIQRIFSSTYSGKTLYASLLLSNEKELIEYQPKQGEGKDKDHSVKTLPKIRILSILNKNLDGDKPAIFHTHLKTPTTQTVLIDDIALTYIQLPKILHEGTKSSWLKILSSGVNPNYLVACDKSEINGEEELSAFEILQTFTIEKNYKQLEQAFTDELLVALQQKAIFEMAKITYDETVKEIVEETFAKDQIDRNKDRVVSIIHMLPKYPIEEISINSQCPIEFVNFVASVASFWYEYCNSNDEDDNFLKKVQQFFTITPD